MAAERSKSPRPSARRKMRDRPPPAPRIQLSGQTPTSPATVAKQPSVQVMPSTPMHSARSKASRARARSVVLVLAALSGVALAVSHARADRAADAPAEEDAPPAPSSEAEAPPAPSAEMSAAEVDALVASLLKEAQ